MNTNVAGRVWKTPGRPVTVTTQDTIAKIHDIIMADRRVTEYYIATELGISQDFIHAVVHNELHMYKVSARWVPKLLGPDLKGLDSTCLGKFMSFFRRIQTVFVRDVWLWMRPGSIISNQRWSNNHRSSGSSPPKKANIVISVFSGLQVLLVDYLDYHQSLICWFSETADQADTPWKADKRSVILTGQCSDTHVHSGNGCYPDIWIPTCRTPTLFSSFGSLWLKIKKGFGG